MSELKDDLKAARERIVSIENFCQFREARDVLDQSVSPVAPIACKFCGLGAVRALARDAPNRILRISSAEKALQSAANWLYGTDVAKVSDGQNGQNIKACHIAVLAVYDHAINQ